MMHRLSLMNISLFTTMIAFNLTPSSLLSKNGVSLRNPSLSYQRWFYFCLFLLDLFTRGWLFFFALRSVTPRGGPCPAQSCFSKFSQMEGLFSAWLQHGVLQ